MADEDEATAAPAAAPAKRGSKRPLLVGAALMVLCGAGAFGAASAGLVPGLGSGHGGAAAGEDGAYGPAAAAANVAFLDIEPIVVTYGPEDRASHLRFRAKLEVPADQEQSVAALMPRITDVLLGYLNALDEHALHDRAALMRLRAQMLRRVRMVVGEEAARDLLVMEYVTN